jgi:uncharacterized repeat protein (TIGR03806 family)
MNDAQRLPGRSRLVGAHHRSNAIVVLGLNVIVAGCGDGHSMGSPADPRGDAGSDLAERDGSDPLRSGLTERPTNRSCFAPAQVPEMGTEGLPAQLSQTGCFDPADPTRPLPGLIPYEVNAPLWSDGAAKERWLALPDGARIHVKPDGDLEPPPGSVTIKTFKVDGRPIETRFFVRLLSGEWAGYTYEWNEGGTDATVLYEGNRQRPVGNREHYFPTRAECLSCHQEGAGYSLGLEIAQLNREVTYPGGRRADQLSTWAHIGLLESPLPMDVRQLPALPAPDDQRLPVESRARAYLHANCANCHRPGSEGSGTIDLLFSTPLAETMACEAEAVRGTLEAGIDARIIKAGNPEKSMVVVRMLELGRGRMPEIASLRVDHEGVTLVSDWIRSIAACP